MDVLFLDFRNAFDRIAHDYLFQVFQGCGNNAPFINGFKQIYKGATSSLLINGHSYGSISIRCLWACIPHVFTRFSRSWTGTCPG